MADPKKLAAEIEAAEKKVFRNPGSDDAVKPAPQSASEEEIAKANAAIKDAPIAKEPIDDGAEPKAKPDEDVAKKVEQSPEQIDWEKRFKNFKPVADATIGGLRREKLALQQENSDLRSQMGEMAKKLAQATAQSDVSIESMFTEEERNLIGDETLKAMEKFSQKLVETKVEPLESELAKEREDRKKREDSRLKADQEEVHGSFLAKLADLVPTYETIDKDPKWLEWMKEMDTVSGYPREQLFINAQRNGDVQRVAEFFLEWVRVTTPEDKLKDKVTPSRGGDDPITPQPKQKQVRLSQKQIEDFYDAVARGKYRNQPKKQQEMEKMIDASLAAAGNLRR